MSGAENAALRRTDADKFPPWADLLGVFKSIEDVPERYRLRNHKGALPEDPFGDFLDALDYADSTLSTYETAGRRWADYMATEGRHPALAEPRHVEAFLSMIREGVTVATAYARYYAPLKSFYEWMAEHCGYPHRYSPVAMAVDAGGTARECWNHRNKQGDTA
jgi:hypothetical protein